MSTGGDPLAADFRGASEILAPMLAAVRRRLWLVLLVTAVAAVAAYALAKQEQEVYSASTSVLLGDPRTKVPGEGEIALPDRTRAATTSVALGQSGVIAERAAEALGDGTSAGQLQGAITIGNAPDSDLLTVTASSPDAEAAASWANAFTEAFIDYRAEVGDEFTGAARVVASAEVPRRTADREIGFKLLLGIGLGLPLGVAMALLWERLDRRLRTGRELEEILGAAPLGTVPAATAEEGELSSYHLICATLRHAGRAAELSSGPVAILAASTGTTSAPVAYRLASAAASAGERTLLVEGQISSPALAAQIGAAPASGLRECASGEAELGAAVEALTVEGDASLDLLFAAGAGAASNEAPATAIRLAGSDRVAELFSEAADDYDLVLVSIPAPSGSAEAIALLSRCESALLTVRLGSDRPDDVEAVAAQLERLAVPLRGSIAVETAD